MAEIGEAGRAWRVRRPSGQAHQEELLEHQRDRRRRAPRPITTATAIAARAEAAAARRRAAARCSSEDRDAHEERGGEPERQAVADQDDAEARRRGAMHQRDPARRRDGVDRGGRRGLRLERTAQRQLRSASRTSRAASSRCRAARAAGPGTVYGLMSWLSSRSMRSDATSTATPKRDPAEADWISSARAAAAPLRRRCERRSALVAARSYAAQGLAMPTVSGETLALPLVEQHPRIRLHGREHRLLRRLAVRRREQGAAAGRVLLQRLALRDVRRPRSSRPSSRPRRARPSA